MKKIFISLALLSAFSTVSCNPDLLEIPQKGVLTTDTYYLPEDATAAITAVYAQGQRALIWGNIYMPWMLMSNLPSDDLYAAGNNRGDNDFAAQINEFRAYTDNEVITRLYRNLYEFIYITNLFIDKYEYGMSDDIDRYLSEARVWRAWTHLYLATWWGSPPLVDHVLAPDEKPAGTPHDEIMNWVIEELKDAAPHIPSRVSPQDKNGAVRLTKEAAYSFLGKAQVQHKKYADAVQTLKQYVIDSGKYELVSGPDMNFLYHKAGDANSEKVFEFNVVDQPSLAARDIRNWIVPWQHYQMWHWRIDKLRSRPLEIRGGGWGGFNPSGVFARALIENDGLDSHRRKAWIKTYDEVLYDLSWSSDFDKDNNPLNLTIEQKKHDPERGIDFAKEGLYGHEGYFQWKFVPFQDDRIARLGDMMENNIVVMRYTEVMLLYIEACVQSGQNTAEALSLLNQIQNRAGSAHVSTELTLAEVQNEKRFECWMEGTRFPDLVRWGIAAETLKDQGERVPVFKDVMSRIGTSEPAQYTAHEGVVDWTGSDYNRQQGMPWGFKAGQHELMPYPLEEMQVNTNLPQNPGWPVIQ